jgi:hypothetical protein
MSTEASRQIHALRLKAGRLARRNDAARPEILVTNALLLLSEASAMNTDNFLVAGILLTGLFALDATFAVNETRIYRLLRRVDRIRHNGTDFIIPDPTLNNGESDDFTREPLRKSG